VKQIVRYYKYLYINIIGWITTTKEKCSCKKGLLLRLFNIELFINFALKKNLQHYLYNDKNNDSDKRMFADVFFLKHRPQRFNFFSSVTVNINILKESC